MLFAKKWTVAIRNGDAWKPKKTAVVCSKHFHEVDFDKSGQTTRLRKDVVPSVFEDLPDHLHKVMNTQFKHSIMSRTGTKRKRREAETDVLLTLYLVFTKTWQDNPVTTGKIIISHNLK